MRGVKAREGRGAGGLMYHSAAVHLIIYLLLDGGNGGYCTYHMKHCSCKQAIQYNQRTIKAETDLALWALQYWVRTLPRGGMYWKIHSPRTKKFHKGGDFAPFGPWDFPRANVHRKCLFAHSVCANFSLIAHSVCANFGLIAHSPVYSVILLK